MYYANIDNAPITVEEYIPGVFERYFNNSGDVAEGKSSVHEGMIDKESYFAQFSYVHTDRQMMVLDLQGVGYKLCDPERYHYTTRGWRAELLCRKSII